MALIIKANGVFEKVEPNNGLSFSCKELKGIVDGYIEVLNLSPIAYIVVNEDGKLIGLPYNPNATAIYQTMTGSSDYIVGDALFCRPSQID